MSLLTPRTATVPLFQGDDRVKIDELYRAVEDARAMDALGNRRVGDGSTAVGAAEKHDAFVLEATERAVLVKLQQLPRRASSSGRKTWRELVMENPPRDDVEEDAGLGFNAEAMGEALVPASIIEPVFESPAALQLFLDEEVQDADFKRLYSAAYRLNAESGPDPKADLSSRLALISGETSS